MRCVPEHAYIDVGLMKWPDNAIQPIICLNNYDFRMRDAQVVLN